jgi:hypothetical protein
VRIEHGSSWDAPQQFVMALNGHLQFIPRFVEQKRIPAPAPWNVWLRPKDGELDQQVCAAYIARLRDLADQWIETGREKAGEGESPRERKLNDQMYEILNGWASRNQPDLAFDDRGKTVVWMPACKMDFSSPLEAALEDAVRFFASFLDSPYRYQLCKCRSCGKYYFTQRKPHGFIKYGTYCEKHRHTASAERANDRKRAPERQRKLELAKKFWRKWPKRITDQGGQAQWVAGQVNNNLKHDETPIKRHWVTRYQAEIQRVSDSATLLTTG